ncbi:MAG: FHA domain-containing protein [bacterium]|nr:FHA domain-containing protein [bacterium]
MVEPDRLCAGCFGEKDPGGVCLHCGYDEAAERPALFLPLRTVLGNQYVVGRELGRPGGFGITYLAWDRNLHERVAIKEYLPRALAGRDSDGLSVRALSATDDDSFQLGFDAFRKEAQTLARFRHPNIVRVRTWLEANDTAYMVMDYYFGETLEDFLVRQGGRVSEDKAVRLMAPVLDALRSEVHAQHYLHRDISPLNIYLARIGSQASPILLDFGAARQSLGDRTQSLSVILKPGFAPPEQYHAMGKQGAWTDVYACAATLYRTVTGTMPPPSIDRLAEDSLMPPEQLTPGLSPGFCAALLGGLQVERENRPQTMAEFQERLESRPPEPLPGQPSNPLLRALSGELAGQEIPIEETLIIGREPATSHLVLARPDLSRQHCALRFDPAGRAFVLEDLESSHGTFVERGGEVYPVEPGRPVTLAAGDRFHLVDGSDRFEVVLVPGAEEHEAAKAVVAPKVPRAAAAPKAPGAAAAPKAGSPPLSLRPREEVVATIPQRQGCGLMLLLAGVLVLTVLLSLGADYGPPV